MKHKPLGREPFSIIPPEDLAKITENKLEDLAGEFGDELEQPPKRNGSNGIEAPRPGIKLMPFDEIEIGAEPFCLIEGLIPRVGLTVIWGPPKSGKSFWTFDACMHIALGWNYRERRVQRGPVVYCAFEGQTGIRLRCEAFRQRFLSEQAEGVPFFLQPYPLDLVKDHEQLAAEIQ